MYLLLLRIPPTGLFLGIRIMSTTKALKRPAC